MVGPFVFASLASLCFISRSFSSSFQKLRRSWQYWAYSLMISSSFCLTYLPTHIHIAQQQNIWPTKIEIKMIVQQPIPKRPFFLLASSLFSSFLSSKTVCIFEKHSIQPLLTEVEHSIFLIPFTWLLFRDKPARRQINKYDFIFNLFFKLFYLLR